MIVNSTVVVSFNKPYNFRVLETLDYCVKPKSTHFKAVIVKHNNWTFMVYQSWKCVLLGCRGSTDVSDAVAWFCSTAGVVCVEQPSLKNLVESWTTNCTLNLRQVQSKAVKMYPRSAVYEPELSPALVFTMGAKMLVFGTGKVIITGVKSEDAIREAKRVLGTIINTDVIKGCNTQEDRQN